ncbi:MAG: hypothetical protein ACTSU5_09485 [Promethearchaeota archaeon]
MRKGKLREVCGLFFLFGIFAGIALLAGNSSSPFGTDGREVVDGPGSFERPVGPNWLTGGPRAGSTANLSTIFNVTTSTNGVKDPAVAVDSYNNTHVVWAEQIPNPVDHANYSICYRRFTYQTQQWSAVVNISSWSHDAEDPSIAIDTSPSGYDYVYVVWTENIGDNYKYKDVRFGRLRTSDPVSSSSWDIKRVTEDGVSPFLADENPQVVVTTDASTPRAHIIWERREGEIGAAREIVSKSNTLQDLNSYTGLLPGTYWTTSTSTITIENDLTIPTKVRAAVNSSGDITLAYLDASSSYIYTKNNSGSPDWSSVGSAELVYNQGTNDFPDVAVDPVSGNTSVIWLNNPGAGDTYYDVLVLNKSLVLPWNQAYKFTLHDETTNSPGDYMPAIKYDSSGALHATWINYKTYYEGRYSYNYGTDELVTWEQDPTVNITESQLEMALVHGNTVQFVWPAWVNTEMNSSIYFREYDRHPSDVTVAHPSTAEKVLSGTFTFEVHTDVETRQVSWYWMNESTPWTLIGHNESSTPDADSTWYFPWDTVASGVQFRNGTILVNVTDTNYLNTTFTFENMSVDNSIPDVGGQNILNVTDTMGHFKNASEDDDYFGGVVTVNWEANDSLSGVRRVELRNSSGSVINSTDPAKVDDLYPDRVVGSFITDSGDIYWTNFFIRTYDGNMQYRDSPAFDPIRIDHTTPTVRFMNETDDLVENGTELYQAARIKFFIAGEDDTKNITLWYNTSTYLGPWEYIGEDTSGADGWMIVFDTTAFSELPLVYLRADIQDRTGYVNHTIWEYSIDNKVPDIQLVSVTPSSMVGSNYQVGEEPILRFLSDLDTVKIEIYNKTVGAADYGSTPLATLLFGGPETSRLQFDEDSLHVNGTYYWNTINLSYTNSMTLKFKAYDNNGLNKSIENTFMLSFYIPESPSKVEASINSGTGVVTISWEQVAETDITYVVYRMYWKPDVDELTTVLRRGSGWFVAVFLEQHAVRVGETEHDVTTITDTVTDPHRYYYIVFTNYTAVGNLGNIRAVASVELTAQQPQGIEPDKSYQRKIMFYGLLLAVVLAMIPVIGITSAKHTSREKLLSYTMDQKVKRQFDDADYGFDARLREMDREIDSSLGKEVKITAEESDFLSQAVDTGPEISEISTPLIDLELGKEKTEETPAKRAGGLCPECGWILSANATKCPRCGHNLLED